MRTLVSGRFLKNFVFLGAVALGCASLVYSAPYWMLFWFISCAWLFCRGVVLFKHVFLWAFLTYLIVGLLALWPLFFSCFAPWVGVVLSIALAFYLSLQQTLIFWLFSGLYYRYPCLAGYMFFIVWFYVLGHYSLWIFGSLEGLLFVHPMRVLVQLPGLATCTLYLGYSWAFGIFLLVVFSGCSFLLRRNRAALLVFLINIASILIINCFHRDVQLKHFSCFYVPRVTHPLEPDISSFEALEKICDLLGRDGLGRAPRIIVFPESFFPFACNTPYMQAGFSQACSDNDTLIFGSYALEKEDFVANAAFGFSCEKCIGLYEKSHRVVLAERFPNWIVLLSSLLGYTLIAFCAGNGAFTRFCCTQIAGAVVPIVCSELFFTNRLSNMTSMLCADDVVVALINDSWFEGSFFQQALWEVARLQVIASGVPLLYSSYAYQGWFSSSGCWHSL